MKKTVLLFVLFITASLLAQEVRSVQFFSDYSMPNVKRLNVNKIDAVGGGLKISFKIDEDSDLDFNFGYQLFSIQQDSALARWNWDFWEIRYKNRIASDLIERPGLAVSLNPIQKMDVYPVYLTLSHRVKITDGLKIIPKIGGGLMFYTRRMYLEEEWQKRFDSTFTFEYSYRNFATNKIGNPIFVTMGLTIDYSIGDYIDISAGSEFRHIFRTPGKFGFDQFVFNDALSVKLGITFLY
ncbi:MAG: hypothetical protein HUU54_15510 [Ignavibacteriaceae bacterium]|nr:hypothetical protein [Ignavibacteriaceae bacterium]